MAGADLLVNRRGDLLAGFDPAIVPGIDHAPDA